MTELEDLLLSAEPKSLDSSSPQQDPYNRGPLRTFARDGRDQALKDFYTYMFSLAKAESVSYVSVSVSLAHPCPLLHVQRPTECRYRGTS